MKHHTHCSVESVMERGDTSPSLSQCVTQVDGLSKLEQHTCTVQGLEDRGHPSRWSEVMCSETSTAQHIIYNINRAVWNSRRPAKTPRQSCPGVPLPLPHPPKKKIHNLPRNTSPSRLPHHQCVNPGPDSLNRPHP